MQLVPNLHSMHNRVFSTTKKKKTWIRLTFTFFDRTVTFFTVLSENLYKLLKILFRKKHCN